MGKVLVACEESQVVCIAFREAGHEAYSCDIVPCSGGHPEWHLEIDAREAMDKERWDLLIAHPPCTHLAVSGARWFPDKWLSGEQQKAYEFFMYFATTDIPRVCIENPVSIMSKRWRKPDQTIQPWMFGHGETKATCLWLKNLPELYPTQLGVGRSDRIHRMAPSMDRSRLRSQTYPGIAKAMATQWGPLLPATVVNGLP